MADPKKEDKQLDRALAALDDDRADEALSTLDSVLKANPANFDAIVLKAEAFVLLDRWEDAEELLETSAHLHKDEPRLMLAMADLIVDMHPEDSAALEQAFELAGRAEGLAKQSDDTGLVVELQMVQSRALAAVGDLTGSVAALERAYTTSSESDDVLVELAMAWFEVLRFDEAKSALEGLKQRRPEDARVYHYLGLLAERADHVDEAQALFDKATALDPEDFSPAIMLTDEEFTDAVEDAFARLPEKVQEYLANVPVMIEPIPTDEDLRGDPPLSPLSLGMFRGQPIGEVSVLDPWTQMPSSILLYQRNLERYARSLEELLEEIETTLLHEVGHFVGWDEEDLRARGLD